MLVKMNFPFRGFHKNLTISHNTMFHLGDNGIVLVGQSTLIDGSNGDHPVGTTIFKNVIFENGIWGKQVTLYQDGNINA